MDDKAIPTHFAPKAEGLLTLFHPWLYDKDVTEILVNQPKEIFVEKNGVMQRYEVPILDEKTLSVLFQLIANENHQSLDAQHPIVSGNLHDGSRVQLVLPPVARFPTLSIRRHLIHALTLNDERFSSFYQASNTANKNKDEKILQDLYQQQQWKEFIKQAILLKKNIIICGGTSSGKTTFLTACLNAIPAAERLIILEDTREIKVDYANQVNLLTHVPANISMQRLVQCSLRLRPDRIIMGEIRGAELLDFIVACNTGHEGSLTTLHANSPLLAFQRMLQLYKLNNVPAMQDSDILHELKSVIDVIIHLTKTERGRQLHSIYYEHANVG